MEFQKITPVVLMNLVACWVMFFGGLSFEAFLVLWVWTSSFLLKKSLKIFGSSPVTYLYINIPTELRYISGSRRMANLEQKGIVDDLLGVFDMILTP